jgi:hypothetical protein
VLLLLAIALFGVGVQTTAAAQQTTYSGRATVVSANILGIPATLVDTGPLPSNGGFLNASLLTVPLPPTLTAGIAHATTVGQSNYVRSDAGVADVDINVGGVTIGADLLMASAEALCPRASRASVTGSSVIVNLMLNGQPVVVTGEPNQVIPLPLGLGQIVLNEQTQSVNGASASITVNALHLVVNGIADIVIGHAEAGVECARRNQCPTRNSASGFGQIPLNGGGKATFAFAGGIKNNQLFGHLKYDDKNGTKLSGATVTSFEMTGTKSRQIKGTATLNGGGTVNYTIDVVDGGAAKNDTFRLRLSNGYDTGVKHLVGSGRLYCGNIRVHKPCTGG